MGTPALRSVKLKQIVFVLATLDDLLAITEDALNRYALFESASRGLYEELERITLTSPPEVDGTIPLKTFVEIDCIIQKSILLMKGRDEFVDLFIRRFDCPPTHREAILTLGNLRAAMERHTEWLNLRLEKVDVRIAQADTIRIVLEIAAPFTNGSIMASTVEELGGQPDPDWFLNFDRNLCEFDFEKLNNTDVLACFLRDFFSSDEWKFLLKSAPV